MDTETATIDKVNMTKKSEPQKITGLGARLKAAREAMQLTEKEAAARLYLNTKMIIVMENEAFAEGPPVTFMRGYLRSYARMLNVPESEIKETIAAMEQFVVPSHPSAPILHATPIDRSDRYIRWITYLILLTLIILVSLWWNSHSRYMIADVPEADQPTAVPQSNEAPAAANAGTPAPVADSNVNTANPAPANAANTTTPPAANAQTAAAPNTQQSTVPPLIAKPSVAASTTPLPAQADNSQKTAAQSATSSDTPTKKTKKQKTKRVISNMAIAMPS